MTEFSFPARFRRGLTGISSLLLFLICLATAAFAKKEDTESTVPDQPNYFFTIDLDPRYQIVGVGALTPDEAAHANCYCFLYGPSGKLEQIEYRRAGVSMPDPLFGVARIDFEYSPGTERRWYRDAQGHAIANVDDVQGEELTLNHDVYPTDVTNLDASGARKRDSMGVIHYVRTLDNLNRLIVGRRIGLFGTPITDDNGYFETRTIYDDQDHAIERGNYDASGNPLNDNDGVALVRTTYTLYPDSTQIVESYFDASGLAVEEKSSGVHELERTIDKRGLLLDEAYFDVTGAPTLANDSGVHEVRYTYDDRGNKLSEEFFGVDDRPKDQKQRECARITYQYDDRNLVIEKAFFGDDGTPQVPQYLGAAVIRQDYDADGNLVRRQFFDGQGHPSPNVLYGAPAIRIQVNGDTTIISLRNAHDGPMKNPIHGYYVFSYKTNEDQPLSIHNQYFDRHGRLMSRLRVFIINPHLHKLATNPVMQASAFCGAGAAALGALLGCILALRKSSHTRRRKVYVPSPLERFLGWFAVFAILEGTLRFFMTVYWAWVDYQNGQMGQSFYVLETIFILFFLYRLYRMSVTMRVLNIGRDEMHRLLRDYFAKADLKPEWVDARNRYLTPKLDVRINYFQQKYHAYLAFESRGREGHELARGLDQYIRGHVGEIEAPPRTKMIGLYYPSVAFCYFLLSCTGFYTLAQLIKGF